METNPTNPKRETVNEKENPDELKHVATGTPVPSGPENDKKHADDSAKPAEQLDHETEDEFEKHNMNDHRGYNETDGDVPVKAKNLTEEQEQAKKTK